MSWRGIAEAVRAGECILFLGAGGARAAAGGLARSTTRRPSRPPLGSALSELLAARCDLAERFPSEDPRNLQRVSLFYEIDKSRRQLVQALREAVHAGKKPSPVLRALAELDFARVITTNYDQLFESALRAAGKQPRVSVYTPKLEPTRDYANPTSQSPIVFKIHGDIDRPESIVVTDEDYIQFVLRMSARSRTTRSR